MDDIRDTRPWFWILFGLVFAVAVVGLVLAISARNDSVDENKVAKEATAEVKEELDGLNGAIEAADEFQEESDKEAAQDRAQIRRAVNQAVKKATRKLGKVQTRVAKLEGETEELDGESADLRKQVNDLTDGQEHLEAEVTRLSKTVRNLNGNG
jgi:predicted  nucleic acid-binding Zn-ribbon protein